ncbi:MAG: hypothetical protein ACK4PN_08345 [Allorhizobium sp.]
MIRVVLAAARLHWKPALAGLLVGLVALSIGAMYLKGRADGRALGEADAKTAVIRQLKERNLTDDQVNRLPLAYLCRELDGVFRDGLCH